MRKKKFDIAILGGGPGGYPAAIRAAQRGKSVALIEAKDLGGTCLNRGCIPSKTLIASASVLSEIKRAEDFGITALSVSFDYEKMARRKEKVVVDIRKGLESLVNSNQVTVIKGFGKFISPFEIKVTGDDPLIVEAEKIIVATGSEPRNIAAFPFDHEKILDSTAMLNLEKLPKKLLIIGGGIIGCEFASLHALLGVDVTILEMMPRILPMEDPLISETLKKAFLKKGIKICTDAAVLGVDSTAKGVRACLANGEVFDADIALVSVGRHLNTSGIGLEAAGVVVTEQGFVAVDEKMETSVPGIYAVGDIASKWWLAHVASHQGLVAADNACGQAAKMHYHAVPSVIFTDPEIATVGMTLSQAEKAGYSAEIAAFPFQALGKAKASRHTDGFAQIVVDRKTKQVLGAQVVGSEASTLIAEMSIVIANELTIECITETIHAHPTVAEAWIEAASIAAEMPVHFPPKKKK